MSATGTGAPGQGGYGENPKVVRTKRRLTVRFGIETPEIMGYTKNLSETGLYIETARAMSPGTALQLQINTPEHVFEMWSLVVWAKRYPPRFAHLLRGGMGCRFIHTSREWIRFYHRWKDET